MMVSAMSGSGAVPGESADNPGFDEEGFASILASLVGATNPDVTGADVPLSVTGPGESKGTPDGPGPGPETSVGTAADVTADVAADGDSTPALPVTAAVEDEGVIHGASNHAVREPPSVGIGRVLDADAAWSSDVPGTSTESPTHDGRTVADMHAPIMGDVGHAVIGSVVADRTEVVTPGPVDDTVPVAAAVSGTSLPPTSDGVSGDDNPAAGVQMNDPSPLSVEESVSSEVADDVRPLGPAVRVVESSPERVAAADARIETGAPSDLVPDPVAGAETDARVESIREVVEWLEGVGLESTPDEMRVEIPDGEGELVVRVTVVDGRLEVDASGSEGNLPERWLDDLRRELDARGFDFAGRREGRDERAGRGNESGPAADAHTPRRERDSRPGVLL